MAIYSRYSRVLEANGDPVLAETLYVFVGEADEYTRFTFEWFQQHQFRQAMQAQRRRWRW